MSIKRPGRGFFPVTVEAEMPRRREAIAGLHGRSRRPYWRSRTKAFLSSGNLTHVNSSRKILLYWPSTWPPCHVVANQELERVAWYILLKGVKRLHQSFNLAALQTKVWFSLSWSHLNSISTKKSPLKSLFQPTLGRISILGSILALDNRIVLLLIIHVNITFTT